MSLHRFTICLLLCSMTCAVMASSITLQPFNATKNPEAVEVVVQSTSDAESVAPSEPQLDVDNIHRILAQLPVPEPELANVSPDLPPAELAALLRRVWAKRQAELVHAMETFKDDAYFMKELLKRLMSPQNETNEDIVRVLEDLEFHVSKLDNAIDFAGMRGMSVIVPLLHHDNRAVHDAALWVIGSLVKGEASLQNSAIDMGVYHILMTSLQSDIELLTVSAASLSDKQQHAIKASLSKMLYCMGSVVRGSVKGYELFRGSVANTLLQRLIQLSSSSSSSSSDAMSTGLCVKAVTLLGDIVDLEDDVYASVSESERESVRAPLVTPSLCESVLRSAVDCTDSDDGVEKVLESLSDLRHVCGGQFYSSNNDVTTVRQPQPTPALSTFLARAKGYVDERMRVEAQNNSEAAGEEGDGAESSQYIELYSYIAQLQQQG